MKAIVGVFQHALVVIDIGNEKIRNVFRNTCLSKGKISLLNDVKIRKRFKDKEIKLVIFEAPWFLGHLKDGVLEAYDEVCGEKRGRRHKRDIWWWNEEAKEAVSWKKDAHNAMCQNSTEENKKRYKSMKNKAKKAVSKAMR